MSTVPGLPANNLWHSGNVLQWDGARWNLVQMDANGAWMYWTAITGGALAGTGTTASERAMFERLVTRDAFLEFLLTRIVRIYDGGRITTRRPDGGDWQGLNDPNNGFDLDSATGRIRANNMHTRNMRAADAEIEGGLVSGDTWDANGNIINPSSWGGILSRRQPSGEGERVRINGLEVTGNVNLGEGLSGMSEIARNNLRITFNSPRRFSTGNFLIAGQLSGGQTRASLFNWLNTHFSRIPSSTFIPIIGTVRIDQRVVQIANLGRLGADTDYRLFGMDTNGNQLLVLVQNAGNWIMLFNRSVPMENMGASGNAIITTDVANVILTLI